MLKLVRFSGRKREIYTEDEIKMGKFEIKNTASGGFKFALKAGNGEIIADSEVYKSEKTCREGIASVKKNCAGGIEDQTVEGFEKIKHPKFQVYIDKAGEYRFRLRATNGQIIATGEGYKTKASCLNGINSIKKNAPDAQIVKVD